jgi:hypothetical protein
MYRNIIVRQSISNPNEQKNSFTLTDAKPNLCPAARLAGNREQSGEQRQANQGTSILIDSI